MLLNTKVAVRSTVDAAGAELMTGGGGRSIVHVYRVSGPVPLELRALTRNVCWPYGSDAYVLGLVQANQNGRMSSRHWYDVAPAAENLKVALVWYVGFVGASVIVGAGGAAARAT
jgi:hypothetical protein